MELSAPFELVQERIQSWISSIIALLPNMVAAVLIFIIFLILSRILKKIVKKSFRKLIRSHAALNLVANLSSFIIVAVGFVIMLGVLELEKTVTSLLAGAGIIGLAISFAFQDVTANFVSGVLIAFRKPFEVNDIIETNDYMGTIEEINLRYTLIRTFQGQAIVMPNKMIFNNPLINYTENGMRRIDLAVGISYGDDLEKVKHVTLDAVKNLDGIMQEKEIMFHYSEFGNSSINFVIRFWVQYRLTHKSYLDGLHNAIVAIKKAYDENDITIPFPIRTLDFGIKGGQTLSEMKLNQVSTDSQRNNPGTDK